MNSIISNNELVSLVTKQLNNFFNHINSTIIELNIEKSLDRTVKALSALENKHYYINNEFFFNPYHSGQYAVFLYYLSNTIYRSGMTEDTMADKVYYLNKIMNSVDWYYEISLPSIFAVEHPLGSVLGRANYSNRLFIYQNVTVGGGGLDKLFYPTIGENVVLYSNATVLGKAVIGDNVIISSGCYIKDEVIPSCSIVFGKSPNLIIKQKDLEFMKSKLPPWR